MSRKLTDIYDALAMEKSGQQQLAGLAPAIDSAQQLLADLDSPSKVARWRLMLWVVATAIWVHERLWEVFRAEVDVIVANAHAGTPKWYVAMAKKFQLGYALTEVEGIFTYPVDDPAARIVKRAAIVEASGMCILKVAKEENGVIVPLDTITELPPFTAYIDAIRFAGTIINIVTDVPDKLRVQYDIYYDPLVLLPNGALIADPGTFPVRDAITTFISSLPFDGRLVLTAMTDAVQQAAGVVNPVLTDAKAWWGILPPAPIHVSYRSHAGHMAIDPLSPLSATINYIAA